MNDPSPLSSSIANDLRFVFVLLLIMTIIFALVAYFDRQTGFLGTIASTVVPYFVKL